MSDGDRSMRRVEIVLSLEDRDVDRAISALEHAEREVAAAMVDACDCGDLRLRDNCALQMAALHDVLRQFRRQKEGER